MDIFSILGIVIVAVIVLVAAIGITGATRRRGNASRKAAEPAPIYTSGVFSLIRKSPREAAMARVPDVSGVDTILTAVSRSGQAVNGTAQQYCDEWLRMAELCISRVENGDKQGVQTYRYVVPEKCRASCGRFGGDAYVTRDQLHHQVQLIPPFHLGCGCEIAPREAWQGGSGGWTPILPVNGQYDAPDWRTVVPL